MNIRQLFSEPERHWSAKPGATPEQLSLLIASSRVSLPTEYLDLLRYSNGGEGPLALEPLWFALNSTSECVELFHSDNEVSTSFPGFVFFGTNGGLETMGFDTRTETPWRIVMLDPIAGPSSCVEIAPDISAFILRIGIER
ncbi:hypothetical protein HDF16_003540 [Granulicella aggregans]|uniref:Knr4/Smi1-like domain-containing protein n=1 Tax=Granulicella aggregans TaxID=474949 RepID=A0A7W7ZGG8_9BACT|nr:SMI1/KNR4 family protein [Granulicella aggregans]MBB5058826.1 hypothetical protein [Granulicella aggregans]